MESREPVGPRTEATELRVEDSRTPLLAAFAHELAAFLECDPRHVRVRLASVLGLKYRWDDLSNSPVATFQYGRARWAIWKDTPPQDGATCWRAAAHINGVRIGTYPFADTDALLLLIGKCA